MVTRRLFAYAAVLALAGCSLDRQGPPELTGPSEQGLSLAITATPDIIPQDGASQASIQVIARDAHSQPVRGLSIRVETAVGSTLMDIGSLTARTISTDNEGRAMVTFTAPPAPPPTADGDTLVTFLMTPIGSNYANSTPRSVEVRLARPGIILPPNGTPTAAFFFSPTSPRQGESVQFDASTSFDSDGQIVAYDWSFGDGETATGLRPRHEYEAGGQYNVILTVTDDRGLRNSTAPTPIVVTESADPFAAFTVSPSDPLAGQPVHVNGSISKASVGRRLVHFEWDFGDGSPTESGLTATHVYDLPGNYVIVLVITDDLGKTSSAAQDVAVKSSGPTASFTVTPSSPNVGQLATFNASGSTAQLGRTITSYKWDFGDGTTGSNVTATKTYAVAGSYTVTLLITDSAGQTGTVSRTVTITP